MTIAYETASAVYLNFEGRVGVWSGLTPPTQYSDPINFEKIEITTPEQEVEKLVSNMISSKGAALDAQNKATDKVANVVCDFSTLTPRLIAMTLGATVSEVVQSSGAVTDEAVTTVLNVWVPLANRGISESGFALKTSGTPVATTKYEVDYENGFIMATHADAVGSKTVDYTKEAITWEDYASGLALDGFVHITGKALDKVTNETGLVDIWRANLAPKGKFDPAVGGHLKGSLGGDLIVPSVPIRGVTPTAPWNWRRRVA